ncbi:MAG: hypothetical protein GWO24_07030, partial [Akkermansiaceae bacterium]|nr:hypothetical protein [Akkermansiaceae bacterium]
PAQLENGDADPGANPDRDSLNNAAERAFGSDPNGWNPDPISGPGGSAELSTHVKGGDHYLQLAIDKSPDSLGAWFVARFSSDLQAWLPDPAVPGSNAVYDVIEDSPTRFVVRDKTPYGPVNRFVKIGIMNPD